MIPRTSILSLVLIPFVLLIPLLVSAQVLPEIWQWNYNWGGAVISVALSGDTLFCAASEGGVHTLNISNPAVPSEIPNNVPAYRPCNSVSVSDSFIFVNHGNGVFSRAPRYEPIGDNAQYCSVTGLRQIIPNRTGDILYLSCDNYGFQVARYFPALHMYRIVYTDTFLLRVYGMTLVGNRLYTSGDRFSIFDLTNPIAPVCLGSYTEDPNFLSSDVAISGHYAYLAHGDIDVLDIANPDSIYRVTSFNLPDYVYLVRTEGNRLYAQYAPVDCPMAIIDITHPDSMQVLGTYYPIADIWDMSVRGTTVYVADGTYGVRIVDCSDPANPTEISTYNRCGSFNDVKAIGTTAAVFHEVSIRLIDMTGPHLPILAGLYEADNEIINYRIYGNRIYLLTYSSLSVVDISNAYHPRQIFHSSRDSICGDNISQMEIIGNYWYLANGNGIHVIDGSNLSAPRFVTFLEDSEMTPHQLMRENNTLYLSKNYNEVSCYDVSDPANPIETGHAVVPFQSDLRLIAAQNGYLYYQSMSPYLIYALDMHNQTNPVVVDSLDYGAGGVVNFGECQIVNNLLYLPCGNQGIKIVDVSNPTNLRIVASHQTSNAWGVAPIGYNTLVANNTGLILLNCATINGVEPTNSDLPMSVTLTPAFPNPFNATTTLKYSLPQRSEVRLELFDLTGRSVATLVNRTQETGKYSVKINGSSLASGTYFARLSTPSEIQTQKLVLLK